MFLDYPLSLENNAMMHGPRAALVVGLGFGSCIRSHGVIKSNSALLAYNGWNRGLLLCKLLSDIDTMELLSICKHA